MVVTGLELARRTGAGGPSLRGRQEEELAVDNAELQGATPLMEFARAGATTFSY